MKNMKRFFSLLLMAALILTLSVTAYAAGNGSITINNAAVDETYKLYKVFDATTQGEDANKTVAYVYTKADGSDALYDALAAEDSPFTLKETTAADKYNVYLKDNKTASDVSAFFKANESLLSKTTEMIASGTTVTFINLDFGYYYISKGTSDSANPTVGVTSVAPDQTINDKSTKPGPITPDPDNPGGYKVFVDVNGNILGDTGDDNNAQSITQTANYGDTVYFMLQANGVNYDEGKKIVEYSAYDVLGEGFKDFTVTKVTVGGKELADTAYEVTGSGTAAEPYKVTIKWVNDNGDHIYDNGDIKIYCKATVDTDATIGNDDPTNLTNEGWFSWTYDNNTTGPEDPRSDSSTVTTKVYAIAIYKTDKKGNALEGAQFEIVDSNGNKIPVTLNSTASTGGTNVYDYTPGGTNYTVVSPASGKIIVKGIASGEYTVNEIVAPNGYNLLETKVTVNATEFESSAKTLTIYKNSDGDITNTEVTNTKQDITFDFSSAAINIVNISGTQLPSTGGIGTTLFYVVGALLMVSAFVLLITKKRMNAEK